MDILRLRVREEERKLFDGGSISDPSVSLRERPPDGPSSPPELELELAMPSDDLEGLTASGWGTKSKSSA